MGYNPEKICFRRLHDTVYDGMMHNLIPVADGNVRAPRLRDYDWRSEKNHLCPGYFNLSNRRAYCYSGNGYHMQLLCLLCEVIEDDRARRAYDNLTDLNDARRETLQLLSDKLRCSIRE